MEIFLATEGTGCTDGSQENRKTGYQGTDYTENRVSGQRTEGGILNFFLLFVIRQDIISLAEARRD
jgi:hypothetical protein